MATERPAADRRGPTARGRGRPPYPDILTPAEWRVLDLLREGLSNPEIAERLALSRDTVKTHVAAILSKLGVGTQEEAAAWQPAPERRPWWAAALSWVRPVTLGKAALIGAAVAVVSGLGVLAWGVWRESGAVGPFPPGQVIAYSVEQGEQNEKIFIISVATGERFNFSVATRMDGRFSPQAWSPDGNWLAFTFTKDRDTFVGRFGLYVAHADGSDVRHLADVGFGDALAQCWAGDWLSWSPDSTAVAYADMRGVVKTVSMDGGATEIGPGYAPTWSHDGGMLAYHRDAKWLPEFGNSPVDNHALCEVVVSDLGEVGQERVIARGVAPVWSTDGESLIYTRTDRVYSKAIAGGNEEVFLDSNPTSLDWAPDGSKLVGVEDYSSIFLVLPGEDRVNIGLGSGPSWSPDGTRLAYTLRKEIYVIQADGHSGPRRLIEGRQPLWRPVR